MRDRCVRRLIRQLQRSGPGVLAGEGGANLWDEICVQARRGSEYLWAYEEEIVARLADLVEASTGQDRVALFIATMAEELRSDPNSYAVADLLDMVQARKVAQLLAPDVLNCAFDYSNARIRAMTGE